MKANEETIAEQRTPELQQMTSLMKEEAAADLLNCSVAFLRRCRLLSSGPAYIKIGRLVRYRSQDLTQYVATCTKRVGV